MNPNINIRSATKADIANVADFFARLDHPEQAPWIEIMMDGRHPYTRAENFVMAEDQASGKILACSCHMPWTYLYEGTPIRVSRMEQVFTEPEYQGQGLMQAVFRRLHELSAAREDVLQVVYGKPGLYRHLGYAFGLPNEEEGYLVSFEGHNAGDEPPEFSICPAADADLPTVVDLYRQCSERYMVCTHMGLPEFQYAKDVYPNESVDVVKNRSGETVGLIRFLGKNMVYALELSPAVSFYRFRRSFLWHLKQSGVQQVLLKLGEQHPFYDVLDSYPKKKLLTLRGYARIADIPAFLRAVAPVLERRLNASAYAGYDGSLVLCMHNKQESYRLCFAGGRLTSVEPVAQDWGDAYLVRDHFIRMALGRLSLDDLDRENAEVYFNDADIRRIFAILFPRKLSYIYSIN